MTIRTVLVASLVAAACSGDANQLSRSQAKSVLSKDRRLTQPAEPLTLREGALQNWSDEGGLNNPVFADLVDPEKTSGAKLVLRKPATLEIDEITGIAAAQAPMGPETKEVQFTFVVGDFPEALKHLVAWRGTGAALVRRFDDGWRVEDVALRPDTAAPALSAADVREIDNYKKTEAERRDALRLAQEQRMVALREALEESKKPTRELLVTRNVCDKGSSSLGSLKPYPCGKYAVTDVGVVDERPDPDFMKQVRPNYFYWFGNVSSVTVVNGCRPVYGEPMASVDLHAEGPAINLCFFSEKERDAFFEAVKAAHAAWWAKYGSVRQQLGGR